MDDWRKRLLDRAGHVWHRAARVYAARLPEARAPPALGHTAPGIRCGHSTKEDV